MDIPIITEYATALAQLKAGNIYTPTACAKPKTWSLLKKDESRHGHVPLGVAAGGNRTIFGWKPAGKSPFRDERVRQADLACSWTATCSSTRSSTSASSSSRACPWSRAGTRRPGADSDDGWWLDPKGKDFGPNAKYFKLDVAKAKKLHGRGGLRQRPRQPSSYVAGTEYSAAYAKHRRASNGMARRPAFRRPSRAG